MKLGERIKNCYFQWYNFFKKDKFTNFFRLLELILLVAIAVISISLKKQLSSQYDVDQVLKYSSSLEQSYRRVKNYFEWIEYEYWIDNQFSVRKEDMRRCNGNLCGFKDMFDSLDVEMAIFFHKAIISRPVNHGKYFNTVKMMDELYWGKGEYKAEKKDENYSFREYLKKQWELSLINTRAFILDMQTRKKILQHFDDLMHLSFIEKCMSVHIASDAANILLKEAGSDINSIHSRIRNDKIFVKTTANELYVRIIRGEMKKE